jgi:hypothetical protein
MKTMKTMKKKASKKTSCPSCPSWSSWWKTCLRRDAEKETGGDRTKRPSLSFDVGCSSFNKQPHGCPKHHSGDFGLTMPGAVNYISHRVSFKIEPFEMGSPALNRAYVFFSNLRNSGIILTGAGNRAQFNKNFWEETVYVY